MPIGWKAQTAIPAALGISAAMALRSMGCFEVTNENFPELMHTIADQGILYFEYEGGIKKNLYQVALDDYTQYVAIYKQYQDQLMGFRWYWQ